MLLNVLTAVLTCLLGFWWGWIYAHAEIATECQRLGGFYVGKTTYTCTVIQKDTPAPERSPGPPPAPPRPPRH